MTIVSLSTDVFETRTATGSREFFSLALATDPLSIAFSLKC